MLPKWENKIGGGREVMSILCFTISEAGKIEPIAQVLLQNNTFVYK
jgi:hypothetical protein